MDVLFYIFLNDDLLKIYNIRSIIFLKLLNLMKDNIFTKLEYYYLLKDKTCNIVILLNAEWFD